MSFKMYPLTIVLFFCLPFSGLFADAISDTTCVYDDHGRKRACGRLKDGDREGQWKQFFPDGSLSAIASYHKGQLDGEVVCFDFEGNTISREQWKGDLLQGFSEYYFSNGNIEKKGSYHMGQYAGEWKFYGESGQLIRQGNYKEGLPDGNWQIYNEHGTLIQEGKYINGLEHGLWKFYRDDGSLEFYGHYRNGTQTGDWFKVNRRGKERRLKY
jgi:antitoxin component YwqK of YwqJK toxin-antitoxin module